jgi:hypothetical protein
MRPFACTREAPIAALAGVFVPATIALAAIPVTFLAAFTVAVASLPAASAALHVYPRGADSRA